jgi:ABC-type amino acid transport system permease subunit
MYSVCGLIYLAIIYPMVRGTYRLERRTGSETV